MQTFIKEVYDEFHSRKVKSDLDNWMFMTSPLYLPGILSTYLIFVLYLGPKLMQNRKPFNLNSILVIYNAVQVVLVTYLFLQPFINRNGVKFLVSPCTDFSETDVVKETDRLGWWAFVAKFLDLLDTVFFVLRKKQSHVSFLHVYHHTTMLFGTYVSAKYMPGPKLIFPIWLNCIVHILMYSYYLIAALGPSYKKYLWWKKYLTKVQLVQFVIILFYLVSLLLEQCSFPKFLMFYTIMNTAIYLMLFLDFYYKTYKKKEAKQL